MIKKIKVKIIITEEKKRLVSNMFTLFILQCINYILPLLTIPYLVRILGIEYFGLLAFATATIAYCLLITDYGFNLSATRQISINRENTRLINEIFSAVITIKSILLIFTLIAICICIFSFRKFNSHWQVYLFTFGTVIGQAILPTWLFQGLERIKTITYLNIGAKICLTISIFLFIKEKDDYLLVPLFTSLSSIITGIYALYLVYKKFDVKYYLPNLNSIRYQILEGWHIFFSTLAVSLYTISTTFVIGLCTNNIAVGYFSAADKIIQAIKGVYSAVSQSIFPFISKKLYHNKHIGNILIKKLMYTVGIIMLMISLLVFLFAAKIIHILYSDQFFDSIICLKIMAFLPLVIALSNILGVQWLLSLGLYKKFSRTLQIAAIAHLCYIFPLINYFSVIGASIAIFITELLVLLILLYQYKKA